MTAIIKRLVKGNPRRQGTAGWIAWNLLQKGMTVEQYLAAGGRRDHLRWDIDKGNCTLVDAKGNKTEMPAPVVSPRFVKGENGGVPVPRADDRKVKRLKGTKRWTCEREWHYENVTFKDEQKEQRTMRGRQLKLMVFISPKGNRYVRAAANEPADLIITDRHALGEVRLRKLAQSSALKKVKRHRRAATKEVKAQVARSKKSKTPSKKRRTS